MNEWFKKNLQETFIGEFIGSVAYACGYFGKILFYVPGFIVDLVSLGSMQYWFINRRHYRPEKLTSVVFTKKEKFDSLKDEEVLVQFIFFRIQKQENCFIKRGVKMKDIWYGIRR